MSEREDRCLVGLHKQHKDLAFHAVLSLSKFFLRGVMWHRVVSLGRSILNNTVHSTPCTSAEKKVNLEG